MSSDDGLNFRRDAPTGLAAIAWRRIHRQHIVWAGIALGMSLILHGVLLWLFPGFTLRGFVRERLPEVQQAFRVREVRVEPERAEPQARPARFRPEAARGMGAAEGGAEAALRRPDNVSLIEPRDPGPGVLIGEARNVHEPPPVERPARQPREEILRIDERVVKDTANALPRRYTPAIRRLSGASDIVQPVDRRDLSSVAGDMSAIGTLGDPSHFEWGRPAAGGGWAGGESPPPKTSPLAALPATDGDREVARANLRRLDKLLRADAYVHETPDDPRYRYCRIEIRRRGDDVLPVLAKDVLLVQDASASITEQKLHFCREGLVKALEQLGPDDRFNVVEFRDKASRCFDGWAPVNPDTLDRARTFIGQMWSEGNTDIFASLKELLDLPREPGRPVIMQVVSDGVATVGVTDRSLIIEAFSAENRGQVSVFTLGTYAGANAYLLDLLSYRNRGDTAIVRSGRWDIPAVIEARSRAVARPVLNDVRFRFAEQTQGEVLPRLTANLYLDKPLVLYVRCPREWRRLVFQATGQAGDITCDMVFDVDLDKAEAGGKDIRTQWAWQKVYALIGDHSRTRSAEVLAELRATGKTFRIRIPYRNELRD